MYYNMQHLSHISAVWSYQQRERHRSHFQSGKAPDGETGDQNSSPGSDTLLVLLHMFSVPSIILPGSPWILIHKSWFTELNYSYFYEVYGYRKEYFKESVDHCKLVTAHSAIYLQNECKDKLCFHQTSNWLHDGHSNPWSEWFTTRCSLRLPSWPSREEMTTTCFLTV